MKKLNSHGKLFITQFSTYNQPENQIIDTADIPKFLSNSILKKRVQQRNGSHDFSGGDNSASTHRKCVSKSEEIGLGSISDKNKFQYKIKTPLKSGGLGVVRKLVEEIPKSTVSVESLEETVDSTKLVKSSNQGKPGNIARNYEASRRTNNWGSNFEKSSPRRLGRLTNFNDDVYSTIGNNLHSK